jgi:hypothetical protein
MDSESLRYYYKLLQDHYNAGFQPAYIFVHYTWGDAPG